MTRAVLSFGSNLGDRLARLRHAVQCLSPALYAVSDVYETPPWGDPDQPWYLNAVGLGQADLDAIGWLTWAQRIEMQADRARDPDRRYGPRSLDVDVIAVWTDDGQPVYAATTELTLPHPRAHLRAFVLRPWLDLEPAAQLPGHGPVADLLRAAPLAAEDRRLMARPDLRLSPAG